MPYFLKWSTQRINFEKATEGALRLDQVRNIAARHFYLQYGGQSATQWCRKKFLSRKDLKRRNFSIKIFWHWSFKKVITIPPWTRYRNSWQICCYENVVKVCVRPVVHTAGPFPAFRSVKWLGVNLLPTRWDSSPWQGYPQELNSAVLIYTLTPLCFHNIKSADKWTSTLLYECI